VEAARLGEEAAVEALYRTYYDRVYRYVLVRVGSVAAAEDLTSQVFLGMLRGLPRFEWRDTPFAAWLYGIAQKQLAHHFRGRSRTPPALELEAAEETVADTAGPEAGLEERDRRVLLVQALRMLPDSQREVLLLRHVQAFSLAETASATGRTEGAVKQLQLRGLATLKQILGNGGVGTGL